MYSSGTWNDANTGNWMQGVVELDSLPETSFDLREAGPDGAFDTADDKVYSVAVDSSVTSPTTIGLLITDGPLATGHYRFTAKSTILDLAGNPLEGNGNGTGGDDYVRVFDVRFAVGVRVEGPDDDTQDTATPLAMTEDPAGSGLWLSQHGLGNLSTTSDYDYWSFTASAGDVVSVSVDPYQQSGVTTNVYLFDDGWNHYWGAYYGGPNDASFLSHCTIPVSETYYVYVSSEGNPRLPNPCGLGDEISRKATRATPTTTFRGPIPLC